MKSRSPRRTVALVAWAVLIGNTAAADEVNVAVAANFTAAMKEIAAAFELSTGHTALLSFGSTGKLYTQIVNGAPFGVFLAADQARPRRLEREAGAVSRFTYATGKLVLWSRRPRYVEAGGRILFEGDYSHLAIANPRTAPYGAAALQVLEALGPMDRIARRLVHGDSIAQTHQFVATGNAELGFVALAQVVSDSSGSRWEVPQSLYTPIRQDAVLLNAGKDNPAARALVTYLRGAEARIIIQRYGYGLE